MLPFVNGMGGTPLLELYLLYGEIERGLRARGLEPARSLVGPYITSLEMAGASLTLLELDDELAAAVGCSRPHRRAPLGGVGGGRADRRGATCCHVDDWMTGAAAAIEAEADHLTQLDSAIGDGDHGINMTRGLRAVLAALADADERSRPASA